MLLVEPVPLFRAAICSAFATAGLSPPRLCRDLTDVVGLLTAAGSLVLIADVASPRASAALGALGRCDGLSALIVLPAPSAPKRWTQTFKRSRLLVINHDPFTPNDIVSAALGVTRSQQILSPLVSPVDRGRSPTPQLTKREGAVLMSIGEGNDNLQIAARLHICENTIKTHIKSLYRKIQCENRVQLALFALRNGGFVERPDFGDG